jgi:GntR family transcriptional regulator
MTERAGVVRRSDRLGGRRSPSVGAAPSLLRQPGKYPFVRDGLMSILEDLAPGDALPPERTLAERLGVSRMTLRRVLEDLSREGLLIRRQGRGTFAADRPTAQPLTMSSFSEHMLAAGLAPSSKTLSFINQTAGARLGRRLNISPSDGVFRIVRLRLADGEPVAIESLHVPQSLVEGLSGSDLEEESFYSLLSRRFGVIVTSAVQTIEATVTTAEESELLGVPLHTPALLFEVVARDEAGTVVEFTRSIFRGDRYKISADIGSLVPVHRPRSRTRARDDQSRSAAKLRNAARPGRSDLSGAQGVLGKTTPSLRRRHD